MINHIIKSFQPKLEGFEVDIKTALGSVEASEGFRLVAKKEGKKINATITYQQDHAVRYALNALLKFAQASENSIDISSAPDFKVRGVVEGFYGKPWSHQQRLKAIENFGDFNFNTYFIAPKDVPWQRFNWRQPFGNEFIELTKELIVKGLENGIAVTAPAQISSVVSKRPWPNCPVPLFPR